MKIQHLGTAEHNIILSRGIGFEKEANVLCFYKIYVYN